MYYVMSPFLLKIHKCFMFIIKCYGVEITITFILYRLK
jgi:hypothetical protein